MNLEMYCVSAETFSSVRTTVLVWSEAGVSHSFSLGGININRVPLKEPVVTGRLYRCNNSIMYQYMFLHLIIIIIIISYKYWTLLCVIKKLVQKLTFQNIIQQTQLSLLTDLSLSWNALLWLATKKDLWWTAFCPQALSLTRDSKHLKRTVQQNCTV